MRVCGWTLRTPEMIPFSVGYGSVVLASHAGFGERHAFWRYSSLESMQDLKATIVHLQSVAGERRVWSMDWEWKRRQTRSMARTRLLLAPDTTACASTRRLCVLPGAGTEASRVNGTPSGRTFGQHRIPWKWMLPLCFWSSAIILRVSLALLPSMSAVAGTPSHELGGVVWEKY